MRGWLYDRAIVGMTADWYRAVLGRLPEGARVLDVGIGTAGALIACADLVVGRDLHIVGVDIDGDYIARARRQIAAAALTDRVAVHHEALESHTGRDYDAVYFAGSFMLFPDPACALEDARVRLRDGGVVVFTQTFQERDSAVMAWLKPRLRHVTGIDFGQVTVPDAFFARLDAAGLDVVDTEVIAARGGRSTRRVVARPRGSLGVG